MQGAAEHVRERIRNTRPSARRRRRRRWGAWAPKHRGGFSAGLLGCALAQTADLLETCEEVRAGDAVPLRVQHAVRLGGIPGASTARRLGSVQRPVSPAEVVALEKPREDLKPEPVVARR